MTLGAVKPAFALPSLFTAVPSTTDQMSSPSRSAADSF